MVRISDRVWRYWLDAHARDDTESIELLFTSRLAPEDAYEALTRAANAVMREYLSRPEPPPGVDDFSPGACAVTAVSGGVVLRVDEYPEDFEGLLRQVAAKLAVAGVEGNFDLYEPAAVEPPEQVDLLECRFRVRGERFHYRGPNHGWRADSDSLEDGVAAGVRWCLDNGPDLQLSLAVGLMKPSALPATEDVARYLRIGLEATAAVGVVRLFSVGPERFRTLAVDPSHGRVTFVEGGDVVRDGGWASVLDDLRRMLFAASPWAVYGFVKRGSNTVRANIAASLSSDWVPVPHRNALWAGGEPFENELAPDVFGAQLLGSGYAGAVPDDPAWTRTEAGSGGVVLEHVDPAAWFARLFGTFGGERTMPTDPVLVPEVVARAREDFRDILFTDDVAFEHKRCSD